MQIKVLKVARHRNGISGVPFHVAFFRDEDGSTKLGVFFDGGQSDPEMAKEAWVKGEQNNPHELSVAEAALSSAVARESTLAEGNKK